MYTIGQVEGQLTSCLPDFVSSGGARSVCLQRYQAVTPMKRICYPLVAVGRSSTYRKIPQQHLGRLPGGGKTYVSMLMAAQIA